MSEIRKVLLAADGSPHSVQAARALAGLLPHDGSAEVNVLTVLSYRLYPERFSDGSYTIGDEQDAIERATGDAVRILDAAGIKSTVTHRFGNPGAGILEECDAWEPQMIVLGSRGLRGAARVLGGSVSQRVIRDAPVPVLVVPLPEQLGA